MSFLQVVLPQKGSCDAAGYLYTFYFLLSKTECKQCILWCRYFRSPISQFEKLSYSNFFLGGAWKYFNNLKKGSAHFCLFSLNLLECWFVSAVSFWIATLVILSEFKLPGGLKDSTYGFFILNLNMLHLYWCILWICIFIDRLLLDSSSRHCVYNLECKNMYTKTIFGWKLLFLPEKRNLER